MGDALKMIDFKPSPGLSPLQEEPGPMPLSYHASERVLESEEIVSHHTEAWANKEVFERP